MATVQITLGGAGCDHIHLQITHSKGAKNIVVTRQELKALLQNEEDIVKKILGNLITFCRLSGAATWTELKAEIESATFQE